ncbi:MAG: hypothetical protein SFU86_09355 [Pirellulaceae bacterium]|nr:hypothetical protein [Pirellulaceae bacterium]
MMIGRNSRLVAILLIMAATAPARADWLQELNRNLGLWWSDGYHAHGDCPPCHQRDWYAAPRRNWQPCPSFGSPLEYLPTPAPSPAEGKSSRRPGATVPASPVSVRGGR